MKTIYLTAGTIALALIATPVAADSVKVSVRTLQPIANSGELTFLKTEPRLEADLVNVRPQLRADVGPFEKARKVFNSQRN